MSPIVVGICGVLLTVAAVLVVIRVERGPSMLDRVIALDVLVAVLVACLSLVAIWYGREDVVLVLTVFALVGFVGSVTLARFAAVEPEDERRILTPAEVAEVEARERAQLTGGTDAQDEADERRAP
ncbi:monovalent cation/H+ antiporter complex subunit F [Ruania suaedae]|uniref:monovalent cation/H+ antiporter complex subunit F n=1 Tax=Ruania suaedae TaxID=2897774 RepID=UPI001E3DF4EF|nr:monovalent cation/H+ antiporter complex subunit F [Ruania suaedae]UFU02762.1 monovalent cation/H+ antiporter complex subunit F [Ruania suaedae]